MKVSLRFTLPLLALGLAACSDDSVGLPGQIRLEPARLDFGAVALGQSASREVQLHNDTDAPVRVTGVGLGSGPFEVFGPSAEIPAGAARAVTARFTPARLGAASAQATVHTSVRAALLELEGEGVEARLRASPSLVDFGNVVLGTTATRTVTLENVGSVPLDLEIERGLNVDPCAARAPGSAFCVEPDGALILAPGQTAALGLAMTPIDDLVIERGTVQITGCPGCETEIDLTGRGTEYGLACDPEALDFGDVNPGSCATRGVRCENTANRRVAVRESVLSGHADFDAEDVAPTSVAPGEVLTASVSFCPQAEGPASAVWLLSTDQPRPGDRLEVELAGRGGGPDLRVTPSALDFGLTAVNTPAQRDLLLENVGDRALLVAGAAPVDFAPVRADGVFRIEPGEATVLEVFAAPSEGDWQGLLRIESNDPDGPVDVPVRGTGERFEPCDYTVTQRVQIGASEATRPAVGWVQLHNRGDDECLLSRVAFRAGSDPALTLPHPPAIPQRVAPGAWWRLPVEMIPAGPGLVQGTLHLEVSHPTRSLIEIPVDGLGAQTGLFFAPPAVDFGALPLTCPSADRTVRIWRHSPLPTTIIGVRVEGDGFSLVRGPDTRSGPVDIARGESVEVVVVLAARPMTTSAGVLVIDSAVDGESVTQRVPLIGRGLDEARVEETFVQVDRQMVDLLFAIDFTGCMTEEQEGLAANFEALLRIARVEQLNYQIGVTTTSVFLDQGRLLYPDRVRGAPYGGRPEDRLIHPGSQPDPETLYSRALRALNLTGGGSADESAMGASYFALQPDLLQGHNQGLLRRDAHLGLLVLTDEPDQTSRVAGSPSDELDFYLDFYRALKGVDGKRGFSAVAIAGDPETGCDGPGGASGPAPRLAELADRSGGAFESVCSTDWTATAEALSGPLVGERRTFFLTQAADPATLELTADGVAVPPAALTYRASDRSVRFAGPALPEPGAEIVIRYVPACP